MFPAVQNLSPERAALLQARLVHTNARNLNYMPTLAGIGNWSDTDLQILHQKHPELFNAFHGAALRQLEKTSQASLKQNLSSQPIRSAPSADSVRILSIYQSARTTHHRELMILAGGLPRSYIAKVKGELITMESKWEVIISMLGHGWQASEVQKKSTHFAAEIDSLLAELKAIPKSLESENIPGVESAMELPSKGQWAYIQSVSNLVAGLEHWRKMAEWLGGMRD